RPGRDRSSHAIDPAVPCFVQRTAIRAACTASVTTSRTIDATEWTRSASRSDCGAAGLSHAVVLRARGSCAETDAWTRRRAEGCNVSSYSAVGSRNTGHPSWVSERTILMSCLAFAIIILAFVAMRRAHRRCYGHFGYGWSGPFGYG